MGNNQSVIHNGRWSLKRIAAHFGCTPKTFARQVRKDKIPYLPRGKHMTFDLVTVEAHLASLLPDEGKVVQFKPSVRKSGAKKSRFAMEVGI